eukprot:gene46413-56839_t
MISAGCCLILAAICIFLLIPTQKCLNLSPKFNFNRKTSPRLQGRKMSEELESLSANKGKKDKKRKQSAKGSKDAQVISVEKTPSEIIESQTDTVALQSTEEENANALSSVSSVSGIASSSDGVLDPQALFRQQR